MTTLVLKVFMQNEIQYRYYDEVQNKFRCVPVPLGLTIDEYALNAIANETNTEVKLDPDEYQLRRIS